MVFIYNESNINPTLQNEMKIVFVQAYYKNSWESLAIGYLASYARKNYIGNLNMSFYHGNFDTDETIIADAQNADILAFTCTSPTWAPSIRIATVVKKLNPRVHIVVGGFHVSALRERVFENNPPVDQIVVGKGEQGFLEILNGNRDRIVHSSKTTFDKLPWPDRDLIKNERTIQLCQDMIGKRITSFQSIQVCPLSCIAGDSYILQSSGIIRLDEQEYDIDNPILCNSPSHIHYIGKHNKNVIYQGKKDCIKLITSNGLELSVTPDHICHKVDLNKESIIESKASDLKIGDWIPLDINQNNINSYVDLPIPEKNSIQKSRSYMNDMHYPKLNEDVAWFLGYIIGDGCLPSDDRPYIQMIVSNDIKDKLFRIVKEQFNLEVKTNEFNHTSKVLNGQVYSRMLVRFLKESIGMRSGEQKLRVPRVIFKSPKSVCKSFLEGLWAADGYQTKDGITYLTTVSKILSIEIANLLMWIGCGSVIRRYPGQDSTIRYKGELKVIKSSPFFYRIEWHPESCLHKVEGAPCLMCKIPLNFSLMKKNGSYVRRTQKPGHYTVLRELLTISEPHHTLLEHNKIYVKIKDICQVGIKDVYDIYSPKTNHTISSNGLYIHNCIFCSESSMTGKMNKVSNPLLIRSVKDTLDEIETVTEKYKLDEFKFVDATWDISTDYVKEFCQEKVRRGNTTPWEALVHVAFTSEEMFEWMAKANVYQINVGCESGSDKVLRYIGKGASRERIKKTFALAKQFNIRRRGFFLLGLPVETQEDLDMTESLIDQIQPDQVGFTINCPYPNNAGKLYNHEKYKDIDWENTDEYANDFWFTEHFTNQQIREKQSYFVNKYKDIACERQQDVTELRKYQTTLPERLSYPGNFMD